MTKWQTTRLIVALCFIAVGLVFFVAFMYFGITYLTTPDELYKQGHDMVVWLSLIYSFSIFIVPGIVAYSLRKTVSNKLLKVLISPVIVSGVFVIGIPLVQLL